MESKNTMPERLISKEQIVVSLYSHGKQGLEDIMRETNLSRTAVALILIQTDTHIEKDSFLIIPSKMNYTNRL